MYVLSNGVYHDDDMNVTKFIHALSQCTTKSVMKELRSCGRREDNCQL